MAKFRVWVRPLGGSTRVRVEGKSNLQWLLGRLGQSFVFKSSEPICEEAVGGCSTFHVLYNSQVTRASFENLLGSIPEVLLMNEPA